MPPKTGQPAKATVVRHAAARLSTLLVWDVTGRLKDGQLTPAVLSQPDLERSWNELADGDVARAYDAAWALIAAGDAAVAPLAVRLKPVEPLDAEVLARLIKDLDNDRFAASPRFRELRAVFVLEQIGSSVAEQVLDRLAHGVQDASLTQDAQAALARIRPAMDRR